jgi:dihydrofolate synthase/folylpolyglutamate synthase
VTTVYLEPTAILGATRTAIAAEKAGIVKPGTTVVVGALAPDDEAAALVEAVARERGARCVRVEHPPEAALEARNGALAGAVLAALAGAAPELLRGRSVRLDAAVSAAARLPGRAELRRVGDTLVVLDGAHVPASLALVLRDLQRSPEFAARPEVVIGMGQEKDAVGLLKALTGRADRVACSSVGTGPARDAAELEAIGRALGLDAHAIADPRAALDEAVRRAGIRSWVLVTGSLHLVGALRRHTRPW